MSYILEILIDNDPPIKAGGNDCFVMADSSPGNSYKRSMYSYGPVQLVRIPVANHVNDKLGNLGHSGFSSCLSLDEQILLDWKRASLGFQAPIDVEQVTRTITDIVCYLQDWAIAIESNNGPLTKIVHCSADKVVKHITEYFQNGDDPGYGGVIYIRKEV